MPREMPLELANALLVAIKQPEDSTVADRLIAAGAGLHYFDEDKNTLLHHAASRGKAQMVELLLRKHPNYILAIKAKNNDGKTPIQLLATLPEPKKRECIDVFLKFKSDDDDNAEYGFFLPQAVRDNDIDLVHKLLVAGAGTLWGYPLHTAINNNRADIVNLLVKAGAKLTAVHEKETPAQLATRLSNFACVLALTGNYDEKFAKEEQARKEAQRTVALQEKHRKEQEAEVKKQQEHEEAKRNQQEQLAAQQRKEEEKRQWLQSAQHTTRPDDFSRDKKGKTYALKLITQIENPEEKQRALWNLLDKTTNGGTFLRISRILSAPSVANPKSTLHEVASELQSSVRENHGQICIDAETRALLNCDKELNKKLKKSFPYLYGRFLPPPPNVVPIASPTPPPYSENRVSQKRV